MVKVEKCGKSRTLLTGACCLAKAGRRQLRKMSRLFNLLHFSLSSISHEKNSEDAAKSGRRGVESRVVNQHFKIFDCAEPEMLCQSALI